MKYPGDEISLGQSDFFGHGRLRLLHRGYQIAAGCIGRDVNAALGVFAVDHVRPHGFGDFGDQPERNEFTSEGVDRNRADGIQIPAGLVGEAQHNIEGTLPLEHFGHLHTPERHAGVERGLAGSQSVGRALGTIETHMDLRDESDTFDLDIGQAAHPGHRIAHFGGQAA